MKYYVYAGYYENFISGHKLPKPYTLRDEFKTFDEALDYVLENWEDDAIFFTEDVIGDAIDDGFINDENLEDYLMKESKKSMKEFNEDINNTAYFDRVAGELHSWYVCYVEDYERKYEYGFKNEKECINWIKKNGFDLDPSMIESKKSARKSIKIGDVVKNENRDDLFGLVYEVKGGRITMYPIDKDTHTYDTRFSFEGNAIDYEVVNFKVTPIEESKKSARKSIKESLNFKKDYEVEVSSGDYWLKPFYWDFDEFRDDLLIASEESGFTYYITTASTNEYRINIEFNNGPSRRYDITFRIIPKSNKETLKELNDYLN